MTPAKAKLPPIHPGQVLKEEFMMPFELSGNQLALNLHVPAGRVTSIINGVRSISPDTALRLARFFGNSPSFWMNLQLQYDLQLAEDEAMEEINEQVRPLKERKS